MGGIGPLYRTFGDFGINETLDRTRPFHRVWQFEQGGDSVLPWRPANCVDKISPKQIFQKRFGRQVLRKWLVRRSKCNCINRDSLCFAQIVFRARTKLTTEGA